MIAEYERARSSSGAVAGNVMRPGVKRQRDRAAPYGYGYCKTSRRPSRYQVVLEEARVVQQIFDWVGRDRVSLHKWVGVWRCGGGLPRGRSFWIAARYGVS